jgi:excinuclease ABC subunit C
MQDKQRIATADNEDADVFGFHFENEMLAVNLFHMRGGKIVDRRDFFWEDLPESLGCLDEAVCGRMTMKEALPLAWSPILRVPAPEIGEGRVPIVQHRPRCGVGAGRLRSAPAAFFLCPAEAALSRPELCAAIDPGAGGVSRPRAAGRVLTERTGTSIEILAPQRGEKRSLVDLVCQNAKQSYDQRFRVLQPGMKAIQEALQDALTLEELPRADRVLRHLAHSGRGDGRLHGGVGRRRDEEVRLPQVPGEDRHRRRRLRQHARDDSSPLQAAAGRQEAVPFPDPDRRRPGPVARGLCALEEIGVTLQPLASIAKREEIIYVYGQENEPVVLDRRSPCCT